MILVTGATGNVGSELVKALTQAGLLTRAHQSEVEIPRPRARRRLPRGRLDILGFSTIDQRHEWTTFDSVTPPQNTRSGGSAVSASSSMA
ncbi:hypothetical protein [Nonomuraea sp. GTA35]|uniref:hypothetical protein n=1 Tax=Nonomuraea sp. GTA35 TaxID=1676746 RepID=UPI0035BF45D1